MHPNHPLFYQLSVEWAKRKGREAQMRGSETEKKVARAFSEQSAQLPGWLKKVYSAPTNFDFNKGIDFIAKTDVGDIYVQIKSSMGYAVGFLVKQHFGRYNKYIAVAVIEPGVKDTAAIRAKVIASIAKQRQELLSLRASDEYEYEQAVSS